MSVLPQTIHEFYCRQAELLGDTPAVKGLAAPALSYRGVIEQMRKMMGALSACGIGRGDRVLIRLPNGPEPFVALHGVAAVAVAFVVDPSGSATELEHFLRFVQPKAILLRQGADDTARTLAQQYGVRIIDAVPTPEAGAGSFDFAESFSPPVEAPTLNGPDDLAYLIGTSGTTALPKLVPKSQRAMLATISLPIKTQQRVMNETVPLHVLNFMPMHLLFALMSTGAALVSGGSVVCMPNFDPAKFYDGLDTYQPYFVAAPPAILEQVLALAPRYADVLARYQPRYVYTGSAALSEAVCAELHRVFRAPVVQTYGMTEVGHIAQLALPIGAAPTPSVGRVAAPENTRVRANDGAFLPPGQVGEIVVRSESFSGYWNNPEADAEAFVDGWFRTGDEGLIDADDHLTIVGRFKEVINSGGAKVSPQEVETVLEQHPQVRDAAVFGLKHPEMGEIVAAAVVGDVSERELRKFASERLPFYKVPMRIVLVDKIPVAGSGKVQRNRLAELLGLQ